MPKPKFRSLPMIVALFWLVIMLVPVLRLRTARQIGSEQLLPNQDNVDTMPLGLSEDSVRFLARRFPEDPAAQALVRDMELTRALDRLSMVFLPAGKLESDLSGPGAIDIFLGYAVLAKRFPSAATLRAQWLRGVTRGVLPVNHLDQWRGIPYVPTSPLRGVSESTAWASESTLLSAVQAAREGARLQPENAFWPWMEAIFEDTLHKDADALAALRRAGHCRQFDDGVGATISDRIRLMRLAQTTELEDEYWETIAANLPHISRMHALCRTVSAHAQICFGDGDVGQGLEISGVLQRALVPIAHSTQYLMMVDFSERQLDDNWSQALIVARAPMPPLKRTGRYSNSGLAQKLAPAFARFARTNGRADLAGEALSLSHHFKFERFAQNSNAPNFDGWRQLQNTLSAWHWVSSWTVRLATSGIVLYCLTWLPVFPRGNSNNKEAIVDPPQYYVAALFWILVCTIADGYLLIHGARRLSAGDFLWYYEGYSSSWSGLSQRYFAVTLVVIWMLPLVLAWVTARLWHHWSRVAKRERNRRFVVALVGQVLLLASTLASGAGAYWYTPRIVSGWDSLIPLAIFAICLQSMCVWFIWRASEHAKMSAIALSCAVFVFVLARMAITVDLAGIPDSLYRGAHIVSILLLCTAGMALPRNSDTIGLWRKGWIFGVLRLRFVAATLATVGSVAYLLVLLASIPMRADAYQVLWGNLHGGEVKYVQAAIEGDRP